MKGLYKTSLQTSDEQLMVLAGNGKRAAFELLYDRYFEKLSWYAFGFVKDMALAEDLVQDVFCVLIDKPESFNPQMRFSTWIYTSVGNRCRNELRNRATRSVLLKNTTAPSVQEPDVPVDDRGLAEAISKVVSGFSEKEQLVYRLRFEEGLKMKEIAEIAGLPEGSVKSCVYYLVQKMTQQLKGLGYGK